MRAMKGNVYCMQHLNKHMRNEWDKPPELDKQAPMQDNIDKDHENMILKAQLQLMKDKYETGMDADQSQTG